MEGAWRTGGAAKLGGMARGVANQGTFYGPGRGERVGVTRAELTGSGGGVSGSDAPCCAAETFAGRATLAAMENGAVYSPTTEAAPGSGRGARSGLAAYFFLGRLPWSRRILKGLQLVRPAAAAEERAQGRGSGQGQGGGPVGWGAVGSRPPLLGLLAREAAVSTPQFLPFPLRKGALPSVCLLPVAPR